MFCPKCGVQCEDNAKFCSNCGYQFVAETEQGINICPHCGEKTEAGIKKCPHCGEWIKKKPIVLIVVISIIIFIALVTGIILNLPSISALFVVNSSSYENHSAFRKARSALNQAISMNYALEGFVVKDPSKFIDMFNNRLNVTYKDDKKFITADGIEYEIIPLKNYCDFAPSSINAVNENTACAKVIVDVNGKKGPNKHLKDRYELYLYSDNTLPEYESDEYEILSSYN